MSDPPTRSGSPDDFAVPFVFVPHGGPEPLEWMAAHPGWVKIPATFVPRRNSGGGGAIRAAAVYEPGLSGTTMTRGNSEPPTPFAPNPYDPLNPSFDPVLTLRHLGYFPREPGEVVEAQLWAPLLERPLSKPPEGFFPKLMERIPRLSGKEAADDTPSWARGTPRRVGETPDAYARRVMDGRWGRGNWEKLPDRERDFRQIKKYGSRSWRDPRMEPDVILPDGREMI